MVLSKKSLERLRVLINEDTEYRSGQALVNFFNALGFRDSYGSGFPSRWAYTDEKLEQINGTPELDACIKTLFAPINYIGDVERLDGFIDDLNNYLTFDKWKIVREHEAITFKKQDKVEISTEKKVVVNEDEFLKQEFRDVSIAGLGLSSAITDSISERIEEVRHCLSSGAPLSVLFLCGSALEGILLGVATTMPKEFNQAKSAPKDKDDKVRQFPDWSLSHFIDTAFELGLIREDVKKFSHSLRDFRNYIHPYQQVASNFSPDIHTAKISWQVLKAAIHQLTK